MGKQLYDAAKSGDVEAVERLLVEGANIEYIGSVVDKLLDKGANIEAKNEVTYLITS